MSRHVVKCAGCHGHFNIKHNGKCPHCGAKQVIRADSTAPISEQDVQKLQEHFGHG